MTNEEMAQAEIDALRAELERIRKLAEQAQGIQAETTKEIIGKLQDLKVITLEMNGLIDDVLRHIDEDGKDLRDTKFWAKWIKRAVEVQQSYASE